MYPLRGETRALLLGRYLLIEDLGNIRDISPAKEMFFQGNPRKRLRFDRTLPPDKGDGNYGVLERWGCELVEQRK